MKPHLKVSWCIAKVDVAFLTQMKEVLDLYAQSYDKNYPVVCFDEQPCFLLADTITHIPTQTGKLAKEHYSYEENGSCCLPAAIKPLQGKRIGQVYAAKQEGVHAVHAALSSKLPADKEDTGGAG